MENPKLSVCFSVAAIAAALVGYGVVVGVLSPLMAPGQPAIDPGRLIFNAIFRIVCATAGSAAVVLPLSLVALKRSRRPLHAILASAAILLALMTPVVGFAYFVSHWDEVHLTRFMT
jgi:hypothetical protein